MTTGENQHRQFSNKELSYKIIGAAIEVHRTLGQGFLESVYEDALCYELDRLGISYERQADLDIRYKTAVFARRFRADLLVENLILIENKATTCFTRFDEAQLLNNLTVTGLRVGLLFNFGGPSLQRIRRVR